MQRPWLRCLSVLLKFCLEDFLELLDFGFYHDRTIGLVTVLVEVILMIIFSRIEYAKSAYFSHDWIGPYFLLVQFLLVVLGERTLLLIVIEDDRAVLRTDVVSLSIHCRWVMCLPKGLEEFVVADNGCIVDDLTDLGMACRAAADFFIRGVTNGAACIAGANTLHSV